MALHIFRKDAIRLWKEILLCQVLLAWLTEMDSWRAYAVPGSTEGWLNLLLPLAWCYLVAACSMLDAVPGERQFWLALPVRRGSVFGAKALFAVVFVHAPYLVSCAVVLNARGFHAWAEMPHLLEKQAIVFLVVTLPSLALASISNNAMQFLLMAIALAGAVTLLGGNGSLPFLQALQLIADPARSGLVLAIGSALAAVLLWIQYRERLTRRSRGIGIAGLAAAAGLYLWLPLHATISLQAAFMPLTSRQGAVTVRLGDGVKTSGGATGPGSNGVRIRIPILISGLAEEAEPRLYHLDFQVEGQDGKVHETPPRMNPMIWQKASLAAVIGGQPILHGTYFLDLAMERSLYASVARSPVTLRGHIEAFRISRGPLRSMTDPRREEIADSGRCSAAVTSSNVYQEGGFRVLCESTEGPEAGMVTFTDTATDHRWPGRLSEAGGFVPYPTLVWLSPLTRTEAYFQLESEESVQPGNWWRVPVSALQHYRVDVQTQSVLGMAVFGYELSGIDLSRYVVAK